MAQIIITICDASAFHHSNPGTLRPHRKSDKTRILVQEQISTAVRGRRIRLIPVRFKCYGKYPQATPFYEITADI